MKRNALLLLALLLIVPCTAFAQGWEITPFLGYKTGGNLELTPENAQAEVHAKGGITAGLGLGITPRPEFTFEARYNWQDSDVFLRPNNGADIEGFGLNIHQITGNFIFSKLGRTPTTWPYFLLGLGATIFDPASSNFNSHTRFTWSLGVGVKKWVKPTTGIRFEAQYNPTYITEDVDGYWCDPFYGCYTTADAHYFDQWGFTLGFVKKLGYH